MSQLIIKKTDFLHYQDLRLPGHLDKAQFNFSKSIRFVLPNKMNLLLVPPAGYVKERSNNSSWLLLREDDFKNYKSQEILLLPEKNNTTFKLVIVRTSGRLLNKGKIELLSKGHTRFEVKFPLTRQGRRMQLLTGIVKNDLWSIKTSIE